MVLFGNRRTFGVEVLVDWAMRYWPEPAEYLSGRCCVWFDGLPIGKLDEWGCILSGILRELQRTADGLEGFWHPRLAELTGEQRFDLLDRFMFAAHRGRSLCDGLTVEAQRELFAQIDREQDGLDIPYFLIHSSEAFDGWKAFLVVPPPGELVQALWIGDDDERAIVHETLVPIATFRGVVSEFAAWFATAQEEWRARGPQR